MLETQLAPSLPIQSFQFNTGRAIGDIMDNYDTFAQQYRVLPGNWLPHLNEVRKEANRRLRNDLGDDVPESIAFPAYVRSAQGVADEVPFVKRHADEKHQRQLQMGRPGERLMYEDVRLHLHWIATRRRLDTYGQLLPFNELAAEALNLKHQPEPVAKVNEVKAISEYSDLAKGVPGNRLCALSVFGMNLMRIMQLDEIAGQFQTGEAYRALSDHDVLEGQSDRRYDLPWLLGSLSTDYFKDVSGVQVRNRTTVGAGLNEIEVTIIEPVKRRVPHARFMLNIVLGSDTHGAAGANHALTILESHKSSLTVQDPKNGTITLDKDVFWKRWALSNLQATTTIVVPTAA